MLPELNQRGIAALGMKPISGHGEPVKKGVLTAEEALRYAMSLPVTTTITGMDKPEVLRQNLAVAQGFQPMSPQEMQALRDRAEAVRRRRPLRTLQGVAEVRQSRGAHRARASRSTCSQVEVKEMLNATENTGHPFPAS